MSSSRSPPSPRSRPAAASAAAPAEGAPAGVGEAAFAPLTGVAALATAAALYLCERHGPSDYSLGATTHGAAACLRLAAASFLACTTLLSLLPRGASLDCRARVVSTVHALVSCYLAAHALRELAGGRPLLALAGERLRGDAALALWRADAGWANAATSVIAGYTAADISFALLLDGSLLDGAMRVHHAIALFAFGSSVVAGFAVPYMALVVLTEASTPLLNFYHTWARHGVLRIANGFLLWLAYVLFRVVLIALVLRHVYNSSTPEVIAHNAALWLLYVSSLLSVAGLNCWWCFLITRILVRALLGIVRPAAAKAKAA